MDEHVELRAARAFATPHAGDEIFVLDPFARCERRRRAKERCDEIATLLRKEDGMERVELQPKDGAVRHELESDVAREHDLLCRRWCILREVDDELDAFARDARPAVEREEAAALGGAGEL